ncbi:antitoxin [Rhodococcus sp. NPDC058514]|uniref:FitA-like ribbon-helix-helix domain-containing protein n=1 Tax=unclassified Rhodococcus (in: high G+C Gram-positive bacteria) TaxID=192944 RepID=UPI003650A3DF
MANIQIRELPEETYEVIRTRARAAGRTIESYLREVLIDFAATPTTDEVLARMESARSNSDAPGATRESILEDLGADRR